VRRDSKPEIEVPRQVSFGGDDVLATGSIVRLSVAGVEIESQQPPGEGRELVLRTELVEGEGEIALGGRVQWSKPGRFAVRFGLLSARETNAVVRAARRSGEAERGSGHGPKK
jgi:hypothetical protein